MLILPSILPTEGRMLSRPRWLLHSRMVYRASCGQSPVKVDWDQHVTAKSNCQPRADKNTTFQL